MARRNKRTATVSEQSEIPAHLLHTLPSICGARLIPGEQYAMRHDDDDPNDIVVTSTQLMQNHVPEGTIIIRAVTDRTYTMSSLDPRPADSPLAMRGMAPPFNRNKNSNRNNMRPPRNHSIDAINSAVPSVGDSEFEEHETGKSLGPVKTPEQIRQEQDAARAAANNGGQGDDSHLLNDVNI